MSVTSATDNKAIISRHYQEIWNAGDLATILRKLEETVASDYLDHNPVPGQLRGIEGLKQAVAALHTAFPDMHTTVDLLIAEDDKVTGRWTLRATNAGPLAFLGLPPTGKPVEMTGIDLFRLENGKIVEWWHQEDVMGMMQQIGLIPPPQS